MNRSGMLALVCAINAAAFLALPSSSALADSLFGASAAPTAGVQTLTINGSTVLQASDTGWYSTVSGGFHDSSNTNYVVGSLGGSIFNDFFIFDLSGVTGPITSATISLWNPDGGSIPNFGGDVYSMWDVTTPINTLEASNSGAAALSILDDLGSGSFYGSVTTVANNWKTQINIALDANALAGLAAAEGQQFAIGGALNVPTAVPVPATLPLFATGLGALALLHWRRKRKVQASA